MNKLNNSRLGTALTTDPSIALFTFLKNNWGTNTGYIVPEVSKVKFDTKFGEFKGFFNFVVIENMPYISKAQVLGATRFSVEESKRVQIMCVGTSAKNTIWHMSKHIESLINGNVTGLQADGINTMNITQFQDLPTEEIDQTITQLQPTKGFQKTRKYAMVSLWHEMEQASA